MEMVFALIVISCLGGVLWCQRDIRRDNERIRVAGERIDAAIARMDAAHESTERALAARRARR
jgi:hypothetical protein